MAKEDVIEVEAEGGWDLPNSKVCGCLLYTFDAADERVCGGIGGVLTLIHKWSWR